MSLITETARDLLDSVYRDLDLVRGSLLEATDRPSADVDQNWLEHGEWLALAKKVGAERVFFVDNNPVAVFREVKTGVNPADLHAIFNRVWCMARPQLLFLASKGELTVYNLTMPPIDQSDESSIQDRILDTVRTTAEVVTKLQKYARDQIETGKLFEDKRFGFDDRADHSLVNDLRIVRNALRSKGLAFKHCHALIGRSIFIRYLEDRKIIDRQYFQSVAIENKRKDWTDLLDRTIPDAYLDVANRPFYPKILFDKDFAYAIFHRLAEDFNGDMFPISSEEEKAVSSDHLLSLQRFLIGKTEEKLFFHAYQFDIIPIELISVIYEEFYVTERNGEKHSSYYTPASLVEFVLSHILTREVLDQKPRIIDPACGSGIFLVESFRRIVRHRMAGQSRRLRPDELRGLLRDQIAGIDINTEAIRVAAFSLYLALLHYQENKDILETKKLPCLTYAQRESTDKNRHFDCLVAADTFAIDDSISEESIRKRFGSACADIVVGNPPWGDTHGGPRSKKKSAALAWCEVNAKSVGDKELSQAFIHKTLDLLKPGGIAGLLVSTGVFFKRHEKSKQFRRQWLKSCTIEHVVNFAAVREVFFSGPSRRSISRSTHTSQHKRPTAPFASVVFTKNIADSQHRFEYWSAKKSAFIERIQSVVLSRADLRIVSQHRMLADDDLWKVYWWGGHRDDALIQTLRMNPSLRDVIGQDTAEMKLFAVGFKENKKGQKESNWLKEFKELRTESFDRYSLINDGWLIDVPDKVYRHGTRSLYEHTRILISEGLVQTNNQNGKIIARIATIPFCFRHSIHGIRLLDHISVHAEILLGIIWSSLTRYFTFMTSGSWGMWHHKLTQETIERIPIKIPTDTQIRDRIVSIVGSLRSIAPLYEGTLSNDSLQHLIRKLETDLDEAIFDLYELSDDERDLIRDMCNLGLDLFYQGMKSKAVEPIVAKPGSYFGRRGDIGKFESRDRDIEQYIDVFLDVWDREIAAIGGRFRWRIIFPHTKYSKGHAPMLAAVFSSETESEPLIDPDQSPNDAWDSILNRIGQDALQPYDSKRIYIDGVVRIVGSTDLTLIKRNERRLWTRSAAREDAEATILQLMRRQFQSRRSEVKSVSTQS